MRIPCPYCGERDAHEFAYLGDAGLRDRPAADAPAEAWHGYVYLRDNPAGPQRELWYHAGGCRSWLEVTRDTGSHAVLAVRLAGGRP
jgi:sarcosine oxidase subunit delta